MMELAMKQTTAPNRMGSHRALSSVMTFSPGSFEGSCCRTPRILQAFPAFNNRLPPRIASRHTATMRKLLILVCSLLLTGSPVHAQEAGQVQRDLIDAQVARLALDADP